jgi:hypothetical protein
MRNKLNAAGGMRVMRDPANPGGVMGLSRWTNDRTGEIVDHDTLGQLRDRAHRLYEANTHIFEDEHEALSAMGVVPVLEPRPGRHRADDLPLDLATT